LGSTANRQPRETPFFGRCRAMANTFGGVVIVGVAELRTTGVAYGFPGDMIGVDLIERSRVAGWCHAVLVPPYDPEVVSVPLTGANDRVVLVIRGATFASGTDNFREPRPRSHRRRQPVRRLVPPAPAVHRNKPWTGQGSTSCGSANKTTICGRRTRDLIFSSARGRCSRWPTPGRDT
jgi:hypothetical protein